jgi:hypothetical protein
MLALLSSQEATATLALAVTSVEPGARKSLVQVTARQLAEAPDATQAALRQAVTALQHLFMSLPTLQRCRGAAWAAEQERIVQACLSADEVCSPQAHHLHPCAH